MTEEPSTEQPNGELEAAAHPRYRDRRTARFAGGERVREFQAFEQQAKKRLANNSPIGRFQNRKAS